MSDLNGVALTATELTFSGTWFDYLGTLAIVLLGAALVLGFITATWVEPRDRLNEHEAAIDDLAERVKVIETQQSEERTP